MLAGQEPPPSQNVRFTVWLVQHNGNDYNKNYNNNHNNNDSAFQGS